MSSLVFAAIVTVFFYLLIFTGSVGRRILIVVPVDTLCRTSIISSSIVLLLNPFANLSLAPLFLFSIYGRDLGVLPDCWVSAEFLRAPIPRKGSGSTTTTTPRTVTASKPTLARSFLDFCLNTFQATTSFAKFVIKTASSLATAACPTLQPSSPLTTKRFSGKKQHNQIRSPATAETNQTVP